MNVVKTILSVLLFFIGELLIYVCFRHFGSELPDNIRTLDMVVTSVIFALMFMDVIFPWSNLKVKSQRAIGSIGIRWVCVFLYALLAIAAMIYFQAARQLSFESQLMIHGILAFLLLFGLFMSFSAASKVEEVYTQEVERRYRMDEIQHISNDIRLKLAMMATIPPELVLRFNSFHENLRYISPCDNKSAIELEERVIRELYAVNNTLTLTVVDQEKLGELIGNCEIMIQERKQFYTNK